MFEITQVYLDIFNRIIFDLQGVEVKIDDNELMIKLLLCCVLF